MEEAAAELATLPLDRWQAEHTRLCVTGYPKTPCRPFESAYREISRKPFGRLKPGE